MWQNINNDSSYAEIIKQILDKMEMKYIEDEKDENVFFNIPINTENINTLLLHLIVDKDGRLSARCRMATNIPKEKEFGVLRIINSINERYKLLKVYLDDDMDVMFQYDAHLLQSTYETYENEVVKILMMIRICANENANIYKAIWGSDSDIEREDIIEDNLKETVDEKDAETWDEDPSDDGRKKRKRIMPFMVVIIAVIITIALALYSEYSPIGTDGTIPRTDSEEFITMSYNGPERVDAAKNSVTENAGESEDTQIKSDRENVYVDEMKADTVLSQEDKKYHGIVNITAPPGYKQGENARIDFYDMNRIKLFSDDVDGFPNEYNVDGVSYNGIVVTVKYEISGQSQTVSKKILLDESKDYGSGRELKKDAYPQINDFFKKYFAMRVKGDTDEIADIHRGLKKEDKISIAVKADHIEEYRDISCYTVEGLEDDSYAVMVSYELKLKDVDTAVPGLYSFYIKKDDGGEWYIQDYGAMSDEEREFCESISYKTGVVKLKNRIDKEYEERLKEDSDLAYAIDVIEMYCYLAVEDFHEGSYDHSDVIEYGEFV